MADETTTTVPKAPKPKKDPALVRQEFLEKVMLLLSNATKPIEEARLFLKVFKSKLIFTQSEWKSLEEGTMEGIDFKRFKKLKPEFVKMCIDEFKMIKTYTSKPKGDGKPRVNMAASIPEGVEFVKNLSKFLETQKSLTDAMLKAGIAFQPFYRNLNEKGKHGKTTEAPK